MFVIAVSVVIAVLVASGGLSCWVGWHLSTGPRRGARAPTPAPGGDHRLGPAPTVSAGSSSRPELAETG